MSVYKKNVIDGLYLSNGNILGLVIFDHLNWKNIEEHKKFLINKINSYIYFIENEQYIKCSNDSKIETTIIRIRLLYKPNNQGMQFLSSVSKIFEEIYEERKIRIWLLLDFSSIHCNIANKFCTFIKTLFFKIISRKKENEHL